MKKLPILTGLGLLCSSAMGQLPQVKHAPTVEQCRADAALWFAPNGDVRQIIMEPAGILNVKQKEMEDCIPVDPKNFEKYNVGLKAIEDVFYMRYKNFLDRHNLYQKFLDEDAAGER
jgi:hypothetical protein